MRGNAHKGVSELIAMILIIIILISGLVTMYILYQNLINAQLTISRAERVRSQLEQIENVLIEATYTVMSSLTINITNNWSKDINLINIIYTYRSDGLVGIKNYTVYPSLNIPPGESKKYSITLNESCDVLDVTLVFDEGLIVKAKKYTPLYKKYAPLYTVKLLEGLTLPTGSAVTFGYSIYEERAEISNINVTSGEYVGGDASSLLYDDNNYYSLDAEIVPPKKVTELIVEYSVGLNLTTLKITLVVKYTAKIENITLYIWNAFSSSWDICGNWSYTPKEEQTYTVTISDVSNYITSDNKVQLKLYSESTPQFTQYIDQFTVDYGCIGSPVVYIAVGGSTSFYSYNLTDGTLTMLANSIDVFNNPAMAFDVTRNVVWVANGDNLLYYSVTGNSWSIKTNLRESTTIGSALHYIPDYSNYLYYLSSSGLWMYDINSDQWTKVYNVNIGDYCVSTINSDAIYFITGLSSDLYIYNVSTNTTTIIRDSSPTTYPVGFVYDDSRNVLWLLGRRGGIFYFNITNNTWYPYSEQIPYCPYDAGNRLIYYNDRLYHFRFEETREVWIVNIKGI